jgi:hypothetical protein
LVSSPSRRRRLRSSTRNAKTAPLVGCQYGGLCYRGDGEQELDWCG